MGTARHFLNAALELDPKHAASLRLLAKIDALNVGG